MKEIISQPLRAAAFTAFLTGLVLLLLNPPSLGGLGDLLTILGVAVAVVMVTAWVTVLMIGKETPEPEFQRLEERSELLGKMAPADQAPTEFDELVIRALDQLPEEFHGPLEHTPVVVSDRGHEHYAYGHYMGRTVAGDRHGNRIVIYQDTLERDFGHDPELLRRQVERTVRHEVAHHLGWDEPGVRGLGL